jgi:hypothetical protein
MSRRPSLAFLLLCACFLIGAQRAALAHMIGHLGSAAETMAAPADREHGAAQTLSHVCTTCAAFAGIDAALPSPLFGLPPAAAGATPAPPVPAGRSLRVRSSYLARAPPAALLP